MKVLNNYYLLVYILGSRGVIPVRKNRRRQNIMFFKGIFVWVSSNIEHTKNVFFLSNKKEIISNPPQLVYKKNPNIIFSFCNRVLKNVVFDRNYPVTGIAPRDPTIYGTWKFDVTSLGQFGQYVSEKVINVV